MLAIVFYGFSFWVMGIPSTQGFLLEVSQGTVLLLQVSPKTAQPPLSVWGYSLPESASPRDFEVEVHKSYWGSKVRTPKSNMNL